MKRILWVTNIILPEANRILNSEINPYGGWLDNASQLVAKDDEIELFVASPFNQKKTRILNGKNITYYLFPTIKRFNKKKDYNVVEKVIKDVKPDIIHVFGTESYHSYLFATIAILHKIEYAVNIQGLIGLISEQLYSNLPISTILFPTTRGIIKHSNLISLKQSYKKLGFYERKTLENANYIFGRTTWDFAYFSQLNTKGSYIKWNETLREEFYRYKWEFNDSKKFNIFVSQGAYPVKGIHQLIKAIAIIKEKHPQIKVRISGKNILHENFHGIKALSQYAKYIQKLIVKFNLKDTIEFIGTKNSNEILYEYLNAGIYILPSSIENSSNSLGEATLLGVPTIASYVGGTPDFIEHNVSGFLYNSNEHNMLAFYIEKIINMSEDEIILLSKAANVRAKSVYNYVDNTNKILSFYKSQKNE